MFTRRKVKPTTSSCCIEEMSKGWIKHFRLSTWKFTQHWMREKLLCRKHLKHGNTSRLHAPLKFIFPQSFNYFLAHKSFPKLFIGSFRRGFITFLRVGRISLVRVEKLVRHPRHFQWKAPCGLEVRIIDDDDLMIVYTFPLKVSCLQNHRLPAHERRVEINSE